MHGDPVQNIDPTGQFIAGTAGLIVSIAIGKGLSTRYNSKVVRIGGSVTGFILGYLAVKVGAVALWGRYNPLWSHPTLGDRPKKDDHLPIAVWSDNVLSVLKRQIDRHPSLTADQRNVAELGAKRIADAYTMSVRAHLIKHFSLEVNNASDFGAGGTSPGWLANAGALERRCWYWATQIAGDIQTELNQPGSPNSGWRLRNHRNVPQAGDYSLGVLFPHSFTSLTFNPTGTADMDPHYILDPWFDGRPDIFDSEQFTRLWPIDKGSEW